MDNQFESWVRAVSEDMTGLLGFDGGDLADHPARVRLLTGPLALGQTSVAKTDLPAFYFHSFDRRRSTERLLASLYRRAWGYVEEDKDEGATLKVYAGPDPDGAEHHAWALGLDATERHGFRQGLVLFHHPEIHLSRLQCRGEKDLQTLHEMLLDPGEFR